MLFNNTVILYKWPSAKNISLMYKPQKQEKKNKKPIYFGLIHNPYISAEGYLYKFNVYTLKKYKMYQTLKIQKIFQKIQKTLVYKY